MTCLLQSTQSAETVFNAVLGMHSVSATVTENLRHQGTWLRHEPQRERGSFRLLRSGSCRVEASWLDNPIQLAAGDLIVFPRGGAHTLKDAASSALFQGTADSDTSMLCGDFTSNGGHNPVLDALPECFVVHENESAGYFRALGEMLAGEVQQPRFGNKMVLNKLADSLLALAIRSHVAQDLPRQGLLAALNNPRLARALASIHDQPGHDWTIAELAGQAYLSRTAFCEQFSAVLGIPPMQYLTRWRMTEAIRLLRDPTHSVPRVAERLGYKTEAAFRRAFKREHGFAPGRVRQEAA